jgi:nicotinate-nucleotide adenylyltransferase
MNTDTPASNKIRLGILGGCFDPITKSHLNACNNALSLNHVDLIWILPAYTSLNGKQMMATPTQRLHMCDLAIKENNNNKITLCPYEIENELKNPTFEILEGLKKHYSLDTDYDLHFIIGTDNAIHLHQWHHYDEFIKNYKFIVIPRQGYELNKIPDGCFVLDCERLPGSSTLVRNDFIKYNNLLHQSVINYAQECRIYKL